MWPQTEQFWIFDVSSQDILQYLIVLFHTQGLLGHFVATDLECVRYAAYYDVSMRADNFSALVKVI
jgi:hypothetical protein